MSEDGIGEAYAERGFVRVAGALDSNDIAMLRREWSRLWNETSSDHPSVQWRGHVEQGSIADRLDPAFPLSNELYALCRDPRLVELAETALGRPATFFKDKLITKSRGTHGYGLHQDWPYWKRFGAPPDEMVTLQIAIDPSDSVNGALEVWPKALGVLPVAPDDPLDVDPAALGDTPGTVITMNAGDVLLLHPLVPHRSGINRSEAPRRSYFITYVSAEYEGAARLRETELKAAGGTPTSY
jgi:ectoine hydroxylase-related dioxygenase (phytanoyl-CoA dioxygenase family)